MIQLHYVPSAASMAPHILLEELGVPFELVKIDKDCGELNSVAYRQLNPNGLMPPLGSTDRAHAYKWLSALSTTLQQALILYFYPERWADSADAIGQIKTHAQQRVFEREGLPQPWV